jgi:hypothetical protein
MRSRFTTHPRSVHAPRRLAAGLAVNGDRADLTVTLKSSQPLVLRVNKTAGTNTTKVGKVKLGNKPAGRSVIPWDLKVSGHKLDPGKYSLVMRAGKAGRSKPVSVTVPG